MPGIFPAWTWLWHCTSHSFVISKCDNCQHVAWFHVIRNMWGVTCVVLDSHFLIMIELIASFIQLMQLTTCHHTHESWACDLHLTVCCSWKHVCMESIPPTAWDCANTVCESDITCFLILVIPHVSLLTINTYYGCDTIPKCSWAGCACICLQYIQGTMSATSMYIHGHM